MPTYPERHLKFQRLPRGKLKSETHPHRVRRVPVIFSLQPQRMRAKPKPQEDKKDGRGGVSATLRVSIPISSTRRCWSAPSALAGQPRGASPEAASGRPTRPPPKYRALVPVPLLLRRPPLTSFPFWPRFPGLGTPPSRATWTCWSRNCRLPRTVYRTTRKDRSRSEGERTILSRQAKKGPRGRGQAAATTARPRFSPSSPPVPRLSSY